MKILIVDDSAFMRKAIRGFLESEPGIEVVGNARDGEQAIEYAQKLKPDLITMDVEMPGTDGLTALRRIMRQCPTDVVMVSSLTTEGSQAALTALKLGAIDVIAKEQSQVSHEMGSVKDQLLRIVRGLNAHKGDRGKAQTATTATSPAPARTAVSSNTAVPSGPFEMVVIGSSTGGPPVVERILCAVPADFKPAIVLAQHMPQLFTKSMADRLAGLCQRPVDHIEDGMEITPGSIYVCPGGLNTHLVKTAGRVRTKVNNEPETTIYYPSVNVLFDTASELFGAKTFGVMLTGMGDDGLEGSKKLTSRGGTLIAQTKDTCAVYGMPKAVTEAGIVKASLTPDDIASAVSSVTTTGTARAAA